MSDSKRKPFWSKCSSCGHCWAALFLPMTLSESAKVLRAARCPMCAAGPEMILVAKQRNGKLLEVAPSAPAQGGAHLKRKEGRQRGKAR